MSHSTKLTRNIWKLNFLVDLKVELRSTEISSLSKLPLGGQHSKMKSCLWATSIKLRTSWYFIYWLVPCCLPKFQLTNSLTKSKKSINFFFLLLPSHSIDFLVTSRNATWLRKEKRNRWVHEWKTIQFSNQGMHGTFLVWTARSIWLSPK